jgi:hypothetical protein
MSITAQDSVGTLVVEARKIRKAFRHVEALRGADFEACAGEVTALIGDNGAGKSSLAKILSRSHNMPDVLAVADCIQVLRLGRRVATFRRGERVVGSADVLGDNLTRRAVAVGDHHAGAFGGEPDGDGSTGSWRTIPCCGARRCGPGDLQRRRRADARVRDRSKAWNTA